MHASGQVALEATWPTCKHFHELELEQTHAQTQTNQKKICSHTHKQSRKERNERKPKKKICHKKLEKNSAEGEKEERKEEKKETRNKLVDFLRLDRK